MSEKGARVMAVGLSLVAGSGVGKVLQDPFIHHVIVHNQQIARCANQLLDHTVVVKTLPRECRHQKANFAQQIEQQVDVSPTGVTHTTGTRVLNYTLPPRQEYIRQYEYSDRVDRISAGILGGVAAAGGFSVYLFFSRPKKANKNKLGAPANK